GVDTRTGFPTPFTNGGRGVNGNIKLALTSMRPDPPQNIIYAAVADPSGNLLDVQRSTDGGMTWAATSAKPPNYLAGQGAYSSPAVGGGFDDVFLGGLNMVVRSSDGGATWTNLVPGIDGNGPHANYHAMAFDDPRNPTGPGHLVVGTDGGIWRLDTGVGAPGN